MVFEVCPVTRRGNREGYTGPWVAWGNKLPARRIPNHSPLCYEQGLWMVELLRARMDHGCPNTIRSREQIQGRGHGVARLIIYDLNRGESLTEEEVANVGAEDSKAYWLTR